MSVRGTSAIVALVLILTVGCGQVESLPNSTASSSAEPSATIPPSLAATATAQSTPGGGTDGLIAFVSTRDGNGEIYVMDADGGNPRRLTNWRQWDGYPAWSPDGKRIAYYSYLESKEWVIKVMDADGSNQRQLTDNGICDAAPYWSPDGAHIAYTSDADCSGQRREIYVMDAGGSDQMNLTQNEADDAGSSWSPDGTQLVFSSNRSGDYQLYVMGADGSDVRRLTENDGDDHAPAWSPDGDQIAFYSDRDGNAEIYVMDAYGEGEDPRRLTNNPTEDWFPRWSPDGSRITFSSKRDGNLDIYVMNADGSDVRRLTDNPREDFNSVWQPQPESSQVETWVKRYAGDPRWAALDGLVASDGGYLLVGATNYSHQNTPREDVYLVKTDVAGEIEWARTYGGDGFDRGNAVLEVEGGYVILGETASMGAGEWDMYLLRVDQDGNEVWSCTYGGPRQERANAIRQTADGGYIIVGQTASFGAGGADLYLVKTDFLGAEVWSQTFGGEDDEEGNDVQQMPEGGFLVVAQVTHGGGAYHEQNPDVYLLRTDESGNDVWSDVWGEDNVEGGHVLVPLSGGGYLVVGIEGAAGSQSDIDFLLAKIDATGNRLWERTLGDETAVDYGTDVIELAGGGYLLTGMLSRSGRGAIPLIRTDANGELVWTRTLAEGRGNKAGMRLLATTDGAYLIVGVTTEFGRGFETILIKTTN